MLDFCMVNAVKTLLSALVLISLMCSGVHACQNQPGDILISTVHDVHIYKRPASFARADYWFICNDNDYSVEVTWVEDSATESIPLGPNEGVGLDILRRNARVEILSVRAKD
jgi:hypothetical protein